MRTFCQLQMRNDFFLFVFTNFHEFFTRIFMRLGLCIYFWGDKMTYSHRAIVLAGRRFCGCRERVTLLILSPAFHSYIQNQLPASRVKFTELRRVARLSHVLMPGFPYDVKKNQRNASTDAWKF